MQNIGVDNHKLVKTSNKQALWMFAYSPLSSFQLKPNS